MFPSRPGDIHTRVDMATEPRDPHSRSL